MSREPTELEIELADAIRLRQGVERTIADYTKLIPHRLAHLRKLKRMEHDLWTRIESSEVEGNGI